MSDKTMTALTKLLDATDALLADMRRRAKMRGDIEVEDGNEFAILDCGNSVLFAIDSAKKEALEALPARGECDCAAKDMPFGRCCKADTSPVAAVPEGPSYFERFCELLRGLEIPPTAGTLSPDQLFLIGKAIAQKAKLAAPEGYVLVKQDLLDAAKLAVGTPHPHPQYEGHRLILSVHIEALEDALAAQGVKS